MPTQFAESKNEFCPIGLGQASVSRRQDLGRDGLRLDSSASELLQLGIRVSNISRLGDSPGSYRPTVANAKTANPKIDLEQSTSLFAAFFFVFIFGSVLMLPAASNAQSSIRQSEMKIVEDYLVELQLNELAVEHLEIATDREVDLKSRATYGESTCERICRTNDVWAGFD